MTKTSSSARPTAFERLRALYASPGPYVSAYLPCGDFVDRAPSSAMSDAHAALSAGGATEAALRAVDARLGLPVPEDVGGWSIHAAADGSTVADFAAEGPAEPLFHVGPLPMVAPMLEWEQWRVPHLTVSLSPVGSEIITFIPGDKPQIIPTAESEAQAALHCRELAIEHGLRLIVIGGDETRTRALSRRLKGVVPVETNVVALPASDTATVAAFANATVRYVADAVARDSVRALEDFRFLEAGGRTVQGNEHVFTSLAANKGERLLVHDDPTDMALASFGAGPNEISSEPGTYVNDARLADVAIWSAVQQGVDVRIIPSTSDNGPTDDIGLTLASAHAPPSDA